MQSDVKHTYIKAVVAYARAWLSIAPCVATRTCGSSDSQRLERAQQAFGSPLDARVRDAMTHVHAKGIFGPADFPKDTVGWLRTCSGRRDQFGRAIPGRSARLEARLGSDAGPAPRQDCGN